MFQPQRNIVHRFIIYLVAMSILPLLVLGITSFEISRSALESEERQHLSQLLNERKRYIDLQTEQIEDLITNISGVEAIIKGLAASYDPEDDYARLLLQARIGYILNGYVNINGLVSIDIFGANGARFHVGDSLDTGGRRDAVLEMIRAGAIASDRPVYWAGIVDNINEQSSHAKVIAAAKALYGFRPRTPEQTYLGLLVVNYSVDYLGEQFSDLSSGERIRLALVDGNHRYIYHAASGKIGQPVAPALLERIRRDSAAFIWKIGNENTLVSHLRSEPSGWMLIGIIPLTAIDAQAADIGKATLLAALLSLLIVGIAAASVSRRVVAPLHRLTDRLKQLREDRAMSRAHLPVRGEDDVADLTAWFNTFLDTLSERERATEALHASEARFRTIFEDAGIGMAVLGRDDRFSLVNRRLLDMLGDEGQAIRGRTFAQLAPPEDAEKLAAQRRPLEGSDRIRRFEARLLHRGGNGVCVRVTEVLFPEPHDGDYVIAAFEDLTAQRAAEAERRARIAAEAASEAKTRFLAHMSHELRTPLNAILGYAQILRRDKSLSEIQAAEVRTMQDSGEQLLMLINDILDLSRIEAGKMELHPDTIHLDSFLCGIADVIRVKAEEKNLPFVLDADPDLPPGVQADPRRLRQILLNLLSNAVKFTDRGEVRFRIRMRSNDGERACLRFEVVDTGVGIAADQFDLIFQPFEQTGEFILRGGGTGLGLPIGRQLARLMGSDIRVESEPGRGSRFWIDIELPAERQAAEILLPQRAITGFEGPKHSVLVVDDVAANREVVTSLLRPLGFATIEADNGRAALDRARSAHPDLILMDIVMPVMNGAEAIRRLRATPSLAATPVIAMSASASDADRLRNLAVGANAFLSKPLDFDMLLLHIGTLLNLRWTCEQHKHDAAAGDDRDGPWVLPAAEDLATLHHMAMTGNMRDIQEWAERLASGDARYGPFAARLVRMAQACQSRAIVALVKESIAIAGERR